MNYLTPFKKEHIPWNKGKTNVYHFWEHDINKSVEECINKIKINPQ